MIASMPPRKPVRAAPPPLPSPAFGRVVTAFAKDPAVTAGKMMASFGLKVDGKIFAMMVKGHFVAKLPAARVDELLQADVGRRFDPRGDGRVMKEWISIADREERWVTLAREARRFVGRPPKA